MGTEEEKKRKTSEPPDGYVCRLCSTPGHWIQVCPTKKTGTKRQRKSDHVPVPGKDPSEEDIERARELQKIPPPKCFCGLPSRLNKVKRSKEGGDTSRAIGKYFFFCSKKRDDETQCRFARPVEMELNKNKKKKVGDDNMAKKAGERKGSKSDGKSKSRADATNKSKQICKFFAKSGKCKKGIACEFSHDVGAKKNEPKEKKTIEKRKVDDTKEKEKEEDNSSDDSSSSSSSSDDSDSAAKGGEEKKDESSDSSDDSSSSSDEDSE